MKTLVVHECPLWKNEEIGRELDSEGIDVVLNDFVTRYGIYTESPILVHGFIYISFLSLQLIFSFFFFETYKNQ